MMYSPVWLTIPAGAFLMGSDATSDATPFANEAPQHRLRLNTFYITRTPITNAQYEAFVNETRYPAPGHWRDGQPPPGKADHPVTYVDWHDALAFCAWAGARLPTEAEWEKAARTDDGRTWPWGDDTPDATRANFNHNQHGIAPVLQDTSPVGSFPLGASPYGALDMAGNVWEWTSSVYRAYPYREDDGRESQTAHGRRVVRGGAYNHDERHIRCADHTGLAATARDVYIGFRVATSNVNDVRLRDLDWVEVPAGEFTMGNDPRPYRGAALAGEAPQHAVTLSEFRIAQTPVTNAEFHEFVTTTNHPAPGHWRDGCVPRGKADHPVTYVDWHDAQAFCRWAGVRLPTEAEWEKAARSDDARTFPWGNTHPDETRLNYRRNVKRTTTTPVTEHPLGASPYGALDMAGNVWEWVSSLYAPYPYRAHESASPAQGRYGREDATAFGQRVLRGGSFASQSARYVRCAMRSLSFPTRRRDHIGFRVATSVLSNES